MSRTTAETWVIRHWPLALVFLVSLHLLPGIFGRCLWKPDEPREAAIAGRMAGPGADLVVPHLGATAFCEKPPLYYWAAAGSIRLFGHGAVGARVPDLLYALAGVLFVGLLARAVAGRVAALAAGALMGTLYLAWRVEVWIATDALLMLSVAGALFACFRALGARKGWPKLGWYALMHGFLAAGFLTKNVVAWIVPALALLVFAAWERRWGELFRWELLTGLAIQAAAVIPWVLAVAARPEGATYLRVFFVNNLFGRFTPIQGVGYTQAHRGWLGAYLMELPVYLLPWTFLFVAAFVAAWKAVRVADDARDGGRARERSGWRFAVASVVPAFVVLSASATMRDIYAAVLMPGFAVLGGLWARGALERSTRLDRGMARATRALLTALALALPPAVLVGAWKFGAPTSPLPVALLLAAWAAALVLAARLWRTLRGEALGGAFAAAVACWVVTTVGIAPVLYPVLNRSQDLSPVAEATAEVARVHPVVIWQPDETIIGVLDFYASLTPPFTSADDELRRRLRADPSLRVLTEVTEGAGKERRADNLERRFGLMIERRVDSPPPGGRAYAIFSSGGSRVRSIRYGGLCDVPAASRRRSAPRTPRARVE